MDHRPRGGNDAENNIRLQFFSTGGDHSVLTNLTLLMPNLKSVSAEVLPFTRYPGHVFLWRFGHGNRIFVAMGELPRKRF